MDNEAKLLFQINPTSDIPIYRQIIDQVNRLVLSGSLKVGDELPSVRQAAKYLEVNHNTISKAYGLLEISGVIERVRGVGMKIAQNQRNKNPDKRLELIKPALTEVAAMANQLALPQEKTLKLFKELLEK